MPSVDQMVEEIQRTLEEIKQMKQEAQSYRARRQALSSQSQVTSHGDIRSALSKILPMNLMPRNVGNINNTAWNFYYNVDFDLSQTAGWPNITNASFQTNSFQVSQEAAFLMMAVSRHANDYDAGGDLGPWMVEFRDRQSSRFFNNAPIPIQNIGTKAFPTILPTPMLILPNAFMDITLTNDLAQGVTQAVPPASEGFHQFTLYGYRFRIENAGKVLSSIFG